MKLRSAAFVIPLLFACSVHASSSDAEATPKPSLLDQSLLFLHLKHPPGQKNAARMQHGLELKLDVSPNPFRLSVEREVKVTVTLFNRSSNRFVHLNFPTSQRIEILVRDAKGKVVNTWSEDQSFTNDPASVTINPGERIEYNASVATREMSAGEPYIIEVSFPSCPDIKIQQQVTPEK